MATFKTQYDMMGFLEELELVLAAAVDYGDHSELERGANAALEMTSRMIEYLRTEGDIQFLPFTDEEERE